MLSSEIRIPLMRPVLPRLDALASYIERIDKNQVYSNFGELVGELESRVSRWMTGNLGCDVRAVTFSSATLGLEVMLEWYNLPKGSKVLVPALTFVATCTAVQRAGLVPVACDIDPATLLMTVGSIEGVDLKNVSAAIPVSTFGVPQDIESWLAWSHRTGVKVLIDAAAAFGGQRIREGTPAVFSLHATKALGSAEGGFALCGSEVNPDEVRSLTNFGLTKSVTGVGTNAKMSEYHAAIALAALDVWDASVSVRRGLLAQYTDMIRKRISEDILITSLHDAYVPSVFLVRLPSAESRERCEAGLSARGIQWRRWYTPLVSNHPRLHGIQKGGALEASGDAEARLLGLPFFIGLKSQEVSEVVDTIAKSL